MSLYSLPRPSGFRANASGLLTLDARSPWLLQGDTPPAQPGEQQPFPNTAVDLIGALGATGVILPANVLAIYQCDTASPLVDSLGLGPNLVAAGAPLTGRECVGLPGTSFTSKVGVEFDAATTGTFAAAVGAEAFADPNVNVISFLLVARIDPSFSTGTNALISKISSGAGAAGWTFYSGAGLRVWIAGAATSFSAPVLSMNSDWQSYAGVIDDVTRKVQLFTSYGDGALSAAYAASATNLGLFCLGNSVLMSSRPSQIAYMAVFDVAITSAMRANFWRSFNLNEFNVPVAYTRAGPLCTRITNVFGNVACYGANQPAVGYAANASTGDNALKTAVVCENGASFLGLGTDNMPAWVGTNATVTATDGPSGMRDAIRVADTDGVNAGYASSGAANIVGASNVSFVYNCWTKAWPGGGLNAVFQSYYAGDAGGPETFTNWTIAGAVSAAWRPFSGLAHTPTRPAQTTVVTRLIPTDNVGASVGSVLFAEVWGVQNSAVDRLAWRRAAAGAASVTATAALSMTNALNARYSPARGRVKLRISELTKKEEQQLGSYAAGNDANGVAFDGLAVWIGHGSGGNTVRKLVAATGALVADYATQVLPIGVCYDSTQLAVWIANYTTGSVTKLVAATGALVAHYASGGTRCYGICYDGAQNAVWVANNGGNNVTKFNAATGAVIGTYAVGVGPTWLCFDSANNAIWVANNGAATVTKLNAATGALIGTYVTGAGPNGICYDNVNGRIWTSDQTPGTLTILLAATGALVATVPGVIDTDLRNLTFDGTNVWVACGTGRTVRKYRASDWALQAVYGIGGAGRGNAWDGVNQALWQAENTTDNVIKLGTRQVLLAFGAEAAAGSLWLDYVSDWTASPLCGTPPQLRLRLWDDLAALVTDQDCGVVTTASHEYTLAWNAAVGTVNVLEGATVLASKTPAPWVPEPTAVTPLYVGSDAIPANAAHCLITLIEGFNY